MRKLFFYIFAGLIFCNIGNTNDIYEYEIEGISIGDSLLEYLKEEEIVKEIQENKFVYKNLSDVFGEVYLFDNFKEYDTLSFFVKSRDKNYNIYSISGNIDGKLNLISRSAQYHPPHKFELSKIKSKI